MSKKILVLISILTIILVGGVSFLILSSNKTTKAVVLNTAVEPGVVITEEMVTVIDIPANTPQGFLKNPNSVLGQKSKTRIEKNQLLYASNFMSSWTNYSDSDKIPDDYVITSISVPDERACGGVITAGDYVDVMAVFAYRSEEGSHWSSRRGDSTAQEIYGTGRTDRGTTVAYILSNVYVLNTNSSLSESQDSDASVSSQESNNKSDPFYVIALSYDDCKKLRQVEGLGEDEVELWLNICPAQNQVEGNSPLIKQMLGQSYSYLHDAQVQVQDEDGNMITDNYYIPGQSSGNGNTQTTIQQTVEETPTTEPTTETTEATTEAENEVDPNANSLNDTDTGGDN